MSCVGHLPYGHLHRSMMNSTTFWKTMPQSLRRSSLPCKGVTSDFTTKHPVGLRNNCQILPVGKSKNPRERLDSSQRARCHARLYLACDFSYALRVGGPSPLVIKMSDTDDSDLLMDLGPGFSQQISSGAATSRGASMLATEPAPGA